MEWQQLEYFHMVAQLQHFTRAAERLSISQPALSRSIARLEEELGVPLFDRQGRSVVLNPCGLRFYEHATIILQEMKKAKQDLLNRQDPHYGEISLAFLKSLGIDFIPRMVRSYLDRYPHVHFHFSQNSTAAMIDQLKRGEIDFCLTSVISVMPEIEWQPLWTEEIFIVTHRDHPLASRENVKLADLVREKFIVLKQGCGSRAILDQAFASIDASPNIAFEGDEFVSVLGFVSANLGIAMLPRISGVNRDHLALLPIADYSCERTIGLVWRRGKYLSPAAVQFREFLVQYDSDNRPDRRPAERGHTPN